MRRRIPSLFVAVLMGLVVAGRGFAAQPVQDWLVRQDAAPGGLLDQVRAMTVDAAGNTYLATVISTASLGQDFQVLKINSSGQVVWQAQYNGPASGNDTPNAICVDAFGEVFVTGTAAGLGSGDDLVTLRLTSSGARSPSWADLGDGNGQGVRRYNGPGNGADSGAAVAVDANGFIYVCGKSVGTGTFGDVVTIKYPQISNLANNDLWTRRYNGPGNDTDEGLGLTVDAAGNVHVLATVHFGGARDTDIAVIKYDPNGNFFGSWTDTGSGAGVRAFGSPGANPDQAVAMALDGAGNIYVTGVTRPGATLDDISLAKLTAAGSFEWTNHYNGPGNGADTPVAIAIDPVGEIVVAGTSVGTSTGNDFALLKFTPTGAASTQWPSTGAGVGVRRIDGGNFSSDEAVALAIDPLGAVYVSGRSFATGTKEDFFTAKVTSGGQLAWTHRYDGGSSASETPVAMLLDASGNLLLAGNGPATAVLNDDDDALLFRLAVEPAGSGTPSYLALGTSGTTLLAPTIVGSGPFTYQWRLNGSDIPGKTGATLSLNSLSTASAGTYSLAVTNRAGVATLTVAELAILQLSVNVSSQVTVQVTGVNGRNYRLDYADEISSTPAWQLLGNLTGGASTVGFNDPTAASANARRFYRLVTLP